MSEEKPKKRIWDKLLMGAIIGGAIGSVVGASIAPKKGKETRKEIGDMVENTKTGSRKFFKRLKAMFSFSKKTVKTAPGHGNVASSSIPGGHAPTTPSPGSTGHGQGPSSPPVLGSHDRMRRIPREDSAEIEQ